MREVIMEGGVTKVVEAVIVKGGEHGNMQGNDVPNMSNSG
jgi:hypothetical protein